MSFRIVVAVVMAAEAATSERRVPPPGIRIPSEARNELQAGAESLAREIESLHLALKANPDKLELLPDVQIFHKAVEWALRYDEFYRSNDVTVARALLAQGTERAAQLRNGETPWTTSTGLVVRGYVSRIDGSVQPYGLVVPALWVRQARSPAHFRLDVWLHGRDDRLTELKFISERQRSLGEFAPDNAFVLHPYGRYCNGFKFAGEVDVMEALEHVRKHYLIDANRIALRGFSMGGAGAWHLGAHYADQWVIVAPGAGFANTADYLKIVRGRAGPPPYEQALWSLYDATAHALNFFNTSVIAYSGEIDKQKAAADAMSAAMQSEGLELLHLIGPKTEHKYEPETKKELVRRVDNAVTRGRNPLPRKIRMTAWSLRYNSMHWVTIEGLNRHWERARVEAEIVNPHEVRVGTENVNALTLQMPSGLCPLDTDFRQELRIDGERIEAPRVAADGSWKVRLMGRGGRWSVVHSFEDRILRKRHGLEGPIDDAFLDSFIMVEPTGKAHHESIRRWTTNEVAKAVAEWRNQFRGEARVKRDEAVTEADVAGNNLILWGDPASNKVLARLAEKLPVSWSAAAVRLGTRVFDARRHVPVFIYPNPLNPARYVVLNSGFTFAHPRSSSNADQTPKLPDYAMVDIDGPPSVGAAGDVVDAGFFDEQWRIPVESR